MSKENVKKFFAAIEQDENLKAKYVAAMKEYHAESEKILTDKLITLGSSANISFNQQDLKEARSELMDQINENGELSDKDMLAVSGGNISYASKKTSSILSSILSFGVMCAINSIVSEAAQKGGCGASMTTVNCK